jgi:hypothetical protein
MRKKLEVDTSVKHNGPSNREELTLIARLRPPQPVDWIHDDIHNDGMTIAGFIGPMAAQSTLVAQMCSPQSNSHTGSYPHPLNDVRYKEKITTARYVLVLFVYGAHEGSSGW